MRGVIWLAAAALAGLAGCGEREEAAAPAPAPAAAPPPPAPPPGPPPPPYVGLWAARPDLCPQGAWVFDRYQVVTAGEVACAFRSVTGDGGDYQVLADCTAEGESKPYQFSLAMAGKGAQQSMTVSRGPWSGPVTLRRCPG